MCSYTIINNSYGCQNSYTLNKLLNGELGFQGFVMSDWGDHHSGVGAALAGMDKSMPGDVALPSPYSFWGTNLTIAALNGTIPESRIDDGTLAMGWGSGTSNLAYLIIPEQTIQNEVLIHGRPVSSLLPITGIVSRSPLSLHSRGEFETRALYSAPILAFGFQCCSGLCQRRLWRGLPQRRGQYG